MSTAAKTAASQTAEPTSRAASRRVQRKLSVGRSNDAHEHEADRVADVVVSRPATASAGASAPGVQARSVPKISRLKDTSPQRQEEEEPQAKLQLKEARATVRDKRQFPVLERVENKIFESKGKGEPLPEEARTEMEAGFRADFSGVRVHTGGSAEHMNRELRAQAFTHGKDVFFNAGKFEPDTASGKKLLAHELTHVVQQGAAEQKVSPETVEKNNAERHQPPPEPADKKAVETEATTEKRLEQSEPVLGEGPAVEAAATGEATMPEPGAEAGKETKEGEKPQEGKGKAEKGRKAKGKKGRGKKKAGKGKAKGGSVGDFLRKSTRAVFESKKAGISQLAANEKKKDPAEAKLAQTEKAVVPPAAEGESRSKASQVESVEKSPEPQPDEAAAKTEFNAALENAVPKTLEQVDKFKEQGKGRVVGQAAKEVVTADAQEVKGTYQEIDNPPAPEPPAQAPEELPEIEAAPETEALAPGDGVVGDVQGEHTDLSEFDKESDSLLEKEEIAEEHLEMVDEGELAEANQERKKLKSTVKEGPQEVKRLERQEKQQVDKDLQKEEQAGRKKMSQEREQELVGARGEQQKTKSKIELKRQEVTDHINGIYETANTTVKQKLDDLEKTSLKAFDDGEKLATRSFENNVKRRINAFKKRRYDRWGGSLLWAKDKLFGMDDLPEVKEIFDSEKANFVTALDVLIKNITAESKRVVAESKQIVADAKKEIETYVAGLGPELQKTGQDALKEMKGKLDALDKKIGDKEKELQKKLAAKREAAIKAIEEKIEKMKEEMSGLVGKLGNLLLNAMLKFFTWALKKAGFSPDQLMGIISKGKAVIKKIVTDPIGFVKNLIKGVKGGINLFVKNIKKHLVGGLVTWLTGAMADVPITLPAKWDLKGILHLVLQILGLTWERIRVKLVERLGEDKVRAAETTIDVVKRLVTEGPMALWEMIKEKAAEIKQKVMDGIRDWVVTQVVKQAVIKLVSFLNPAGAIVQAIIAIYNTVMFFVENWQRIVDFVESVFNSIGDIAMGKLSKASQMVENALAMTIPIILSFLARLIGLDGIGKKVQAVIESIRAPIDKIVRKVIDRIAMTAEKLFAKAKQGAGKLKDKIISWWTVKEEFKTNNGESHELFFKGSGAKSKLMMASDAPLGVLEHIAKRRRSRKRLTKAQKAALDDAEKKQKALNQFVIKNTNTTKANSPSTMDLRPQIQRRLSTIKKNLIEGDIDPAKEEIPLTTVTFQMKSGKSGVVKAEPLTKLAGNTTGKNVVSGQPPFPLGWTFAQQSNKANPALGPTSTGRPKRSVDWVRAHLLSHQLHGPATKWNLVPARQGVNTSLKNLELETVKRLKSNKNEILSYQTTVTYKSGKPLSGPSMTGNESHYPSRIEVIVKKKEKGKYVLDKKVPITGNYSPPGVVDPKELFKAVRGSVKRAVAQSHKEGVKARWSLINMNLHITSPQRPKPWLTPKHISTLKGIITRMNNEWENS